MNELSKELQKHGMADSTAEAFSKAGDMVRDEAVGEVLSKSSAKDGFDHKYQIMLERQNRQFSQEITELKEKVAKMQAEIEILKAEKPMQPAKPKQETQTKFPQKEESKEHPKQGGFTSEDVAVDKVFYFGKK